MSTPQKKPVEGVPVELDMAKLRAHTRTYDAARYLKTKEQMAAYLEAALEDGDPRLVKVALGTIARAEG